MPQMLPPLGYAPYSRVVRMHTSLLSPFLKRVAAGCQCRERHGASVADTPPVRVGFILVQFPFKENYYFRYQG